MYEEVRGISRDSDKNNRAPVQQKGHKKGKRSPGSALSQTAALPRHQEEEETDKTKQAQIKQTYKKYQD